MVINNDNTIQIRYYKLTKLYINTLNIYIYFQLENGARPCIKCDNGFFPINVAGKCAAARTLEVLIQHGNTFSNPLYYVFTLQRRTNDMA